MLYDGIYDIIDRDMTYLRRQYGEHIAQPYFYKILFR